MAFKKSIFTKNGNLDSISGPYAIPYKILNLV